MLCMFRGNEDSSSVMEYCRSIMGYNVVSSSFDCVTYYVIKLAQACHKVSLDDNLLSHVVTMSLWQFVITFLI